MTESVCERGVYVGEEYGPGQWFSDAQIEAGVEYLVSERSWCSTTARADLLRLLAAMQVDESVEAETDEDEVSFLARVFLLGKAGHITAAQYRRLDEIAGRTQMFAESSRG